MPRPSRSFPLLVALALVALARPAAAVSMLDVVWSATSGTGTTGTSSILAVPGDRIQASIQLSADADGVSAYSVSIRFDTDLRDELDLISTLELTPPAFPLFLSPGVASVQESALFQEGHVLSCEAAALGAGLVNASATICQIEFLVTGNVETDGLDLVTGFFNPGIDGMFDSGGNPITPSFGGASISVPEPGTGALLLLGLIPLAAGARNGREGQGHA